MYVQINSPQQSRETDCKSARTQSDACRSCPIGIARDRTRSQSVGRVRVDQWSIGSGGSPVLKTPCLCCTIIFAYGLRGHPSDRTLIGQSPRQSIASQLPTGIGTVREPPSSAAGVAERWPRGFTRICNRFPSSSPQGSDGQGEFQAKILVLPYSPVCSTHFFVLILVLKTQMRTIYGCVLSKGSFCCFGEKGKFTRELTIHG